ncbi:alkaline phosphatase family protein [Neptunitalea lumnitzerae]|uniref:Alkaline phosphatase family protein n=1 Tax=Neptunitalea lumnitzerae TaxID=2965509 RepID=A0ABQ5MIM7_9FLAO|nr:ectonucleotide pyrophosphatase/phosphodiesterase [Neptunitalea sp. Y10]GLB48920.1 alkaline phosphatase family protein [Neptunitalea sp. Y10]
MSFLKQVIQTLSTSTLFLVSLIAMGQENISYEETVAQEITNTEITNSKETLEKPYVIMVSIDGFRHDYAQKYNATNILEMAKSGSSVEQLIPSFPSKTFPNHYSIATGLYPGHHGIVSNSFYDKKKQEQYKISKREVVENGAWYGGTPIWNLAQQQGMCSASYFWVGSEANINGMHPTYYYIFNQQRLYEHRVKRVLEWLELPEERRPHMITLYFSIVDTQGHRFGTDNNKVKNAVALVDHQIELLREGIKKSNLPVYLIVTSDHGMDDVTAEINLHDYIDMGENKFYKGPVAMIYTTDDTEKERLYNILSQQTGFKTYKQEAVPNYLNYQNPDKIGDLVLITEAPKTITYRKSKRSKAMKPSGTHGYDPFKNTNMGAIFYIEGPNIKKNYVQSAVENVHIYPLIAHLLQLNITDTIDGKLEALQSVLTE